MPQDSDLTLAPLLHQGENLDLGSAFSGTRPFLSEIAAQFTRARNERSHRKAQKDAQDEKRLDDEKKAKNQENQQSSDITLFVQVTHQIEQRMAELEKGMAWRYKQLQSKYGDNALDGMVATFLSEDNHIELLTDEQKHQALADYFLNEDGTIKPGYEDMTEALYIRDWHEHQKLKSELEQMNELQATPANHREPDDVSLTGNEIDSSASGFTFR